MAAIASIHLAEFPIWVQRQLNPRDRLVAIYEGEQIVACSPALHNAGLRTGDSLRHAGLLFPRITFLPRNRREEESLWEDILHLLSDISPRVESVRPGWALLEPGGREGLRLVAQALGARVGITSRRFTSMLAALQAPERGMMELTPSGARRMLEASRTELLTEIGFEPETVEQLRNDGLTTLGRIWKLTRVHLASRLGPEGELLFRLLHPEGREAPVQEFQPPPSVVVSYDFSYPAADFGALLPALDELAHRGAAELAGRDARLLTLRLTGRGTGIGETRRILKVATSRPYPLYVAAEAILRTLIREQIPVEQMTLELGGLTGPELCPEGSSSVSSRPSPVRLDVRHHQNVFGSVRSLH